MSCPHASTAASKQEYTDGTMLFTVVADRMPDCFALSPKCKPNADITENDVFLHVVPPFVHGNISLQDNNIFHNPHTSLLSNCSFSGHTTWRTMKGSGGRWYFRTKLRRATEGATRSRTSSCTVCMAPCARWISSCAARCCNNPSPNTHATCGSQSEFFIDATSAFLDEQNSCCRNQQCCLHGQSLCDWWCCSQPQLWTTVCLGPGQLPEVWTGMRGIWEIHDQRHPRHMVQRQREHHP